MSNRASIGFFDGITIALLTIATLLILRGTWMADEWLAMGWGLPLGLALGIGAALLAYRTASLHPALRHIYLLHYVAMAGLGSGGVLVLSAGALSNFPLIEQLMLACIAAGGPWVIGHLIASASGMEKRSRFLGLIAGLLTAVPLMALGNGVLGLIVVFMLARFVYTHLTSDLSDKPIVPDPSWPATTFVWFNVAVLVGAFPLLGIFFYVGFAGFIEDAGSPASQTVWDTLSSPSLFSYPVAVIYFAKTTVLYLAALLIASCVFLWPNREQAPLSRTLALACFATGPVLAATVSGSAHFLTTPLVVLMMGMGTLGIAWGGRSSRWRAFFLVLALATMLLQSATPIRLANPAWGSVLWLPEALAQAILWAVAYLVSLRGWRNAEGEKPPVHTHN